MVGTKGKSGGKREGAGHPTLAEQFITAADEWDYQIGMNENALALEAAKKAKQLQKKIEARYKKIFNELRELEEIQRNRKWYAVEGAELPKNGG